MTQTQDQRIAKEEQEWNCPKLLVFGFSFLAVCIALIYALASL